MKLNAMKWGAILVLLSACAPGPQGGEGPQGPGPMGRMGERRGMLRPGMLRATIPQPPPFPDTTGFGTAVLVAVRAPDTALWLGTYGDGLFVNRPRARTWEHIVAKEGDSTSISWNYINAIGFTRHGTVWYGTVGNGFGRSTDGGKTWRSWGLAQLGPEWQYVAPDGIRGRGDTIYIATADGLRISGDNGRTWRCIRGPAPSIPPLSPPRDGCTQSVNSLPSEYLLALDLAPDGAIWVGHLRGLSVSRNGGTSWTTVAGVPATRVRAIRVATDSSIWVATETGYYRAPNLRGDFKPAPVVVGGYGAPPGLPRAFITYPAAHPPAIASSRGLLVPERDSSYHIYTGSGELFHPAADLWTGIWDPGRLLPETGSDIGFYPMLPIRSRPWDLANAPMAGPPAGPKHPWLLRPIAEDANPYIDQTYRYGSTMGGAFQQHQGVEFNEPDGTPVHAIADGTVVYAGPAEAGANTVAIRHDQGWGNRYVFSTYYHNSRIYAQLGQHVHAGDIIALVGNTGRATNDHLHLEVHVAPTVDSAQIVNPAQRFPPFTVNPQLWIAPLPGDGVVAGRVLDAAGNPVSGVRVYGLNLPYPTETPFIFAETYGDKVHPDPAYDENFAVGDVPPGRYLLGAIIAGQPVWRTVVVAAGRVSWVELRPGTPAP